MSFWSVITSLVSAFNPVTFLINTALSWAISEILSDDLEQELDAKYSGTLVNKNSNIAQIPVIYGERKVGGTRAFVATSGTDNEYLYMVLALCEGEVDSIGDIYINDVLSTDSKFSGLVSITKYTGTDSQTADSTLTGASIGWTSAHRLRGVAYLAIRVKWDNDVFGGIPTFHAVVKGRKVYNPATSTTTWSDNPALCLRDYLINNRYGKGLSSSAIDDTLFNAAKTKCDETVTPYSGGSDQAIFTCNAVINTSKTLMGNVKVLLSGMRGIMPYQQGKYGLIIEDEGTASFDFTEDHIIGGITIQSEQKNTKFNRVVATFANPDANWQMDQIEYPEAGSTEESGYLSDDGVELIGRIDLPTIINIYTAEDIAEIALKRSRNALAVAFTATSEALECAVGDIVSVTHSTPAWDEKTFRVMQLSLNADGTVGVELIEHQDSIYPWSQKTEKDDISDTNLPDPFTVAAPTNLTVATGSTHYLVQNDGVIIIRAFVSWTASADKFVNHYEIQWKYSSDSDWQNDVSTIANGVYISGFKTGETIDVRIKAVSAIGVSSAWLIVSGTTITAHATAPAVPTGLTATAKQGAIELSWTNPTDTDFAYVEINRHTSNSQGASSLFIKTSNTKVVDQVGEAETRYYWARAFNRSSIASAWTSVASATSTSYPVAAAADPTMTHTGLVYYATNQASAPATPSASSYSFATGAMTGLTSGWSITPPVLNIGQADKYWSSRWAVEETTSGGGTGTPTFQTAVAQFSFDGVVTFTNSNTVSDGSNSVTTSGLLASGGAAADINANSTTIDGGKITADSITANMITSGTFDGIELEIGTGNTPSSAAFEVNSAGVVWTDGIIGGIISADNTNVDSPAISATTQRGQVGVWGKVDSTNSSTSAHGVRGTNYYNTGSRVQTSGLVGPANGYDFYAEGAGTNYGPFTGAHDVLIANDKSVSVGDLVIDVECVARRGLSNTLFNVEASTISCQKAVIGVVVNEPLTLSEQIPAVFILGFNHADNSVEISPKYENVKNNYKLAAVNAVGEGQINVTAEGGDIEAGDLIVASSTAGKGMRQSDNIVRSHTVARSRENVSFVNNFEKTAACIYLCG